MSLWDPLTCRACLVTEVKLFNLHQSGLAGLFGFIAGSPVDPSDGLPQSVCYYCRGQLLKFKEFRQKCHQTMIFFSENTHTMLSSEEGDALAVSLADTAVLQMVPKDNIINFDRKKCFIPLFKTRTLVINYKPTEDNINDDEFKFYSSSDHLDNLIFFNDNDNAYGDLKNSDSDDDEKNTKIFDEISNNDFNIGKENNVNIEVNVKTENIEESDDVSVKDTIEFNSDEVNTNTNIIKEEKVKKRKLKQKNIDTKQKTNKKTRKNKYNDNETDITAEKNKNNRYNEKFETHYEEFSKLHNVKVVCLSKEEQIKSIQERKNSKEYKDSRFSCEICYKGFMSNTAHMRHMKAHDPISGSFVCDVCQMRYPTQRNLNTHLRSHRKIFACNLCEQVNFCITRAKLHSRWHKGDKFECNVCQKQFNANTTYLSHMRELHKPVSCTDCGETLLGTNELNKHRNTTHKDGQNECSNCAVVFHTSEALQRHQSDNECSGKTELKTRPCVLCGASLACRSSLAAHMSSEHRASIYPCEQCKSVFTSDRALSIHFSNAHYSLKPRASKPAEKRQYLCECCAKSFPTSRRLLLHRSLHSDERPYKCSLCPKRLRTQSGLEFHMNSHTGRRPYKCRVCADTFKSHAHRSNHQLTKHSVRERRHKCQYCEKSFVMRSDLRKHVQYVHLLHPRPKHKIKKKTHE